MSTATPNQVTFGKWLPCLFLAAAVFVVYGNIYDNMLLFDDNILIVNNDYLANWHFVYALLTQPTIAGAHEAGGFYRPVQMLLYFLIYQVNGPEPFLYHLLNVGLHAFDAACVFLLGLRLGFRPWGAFLAALIWALHPLDTEAVTYVSGTADPLFTGFCLLGLLIMLPDFTPRRIWLSLPCLILGLLSKEGAVIFPALAVICIFLKAEDRLNPRIYLITWPLWLVAVGYALWRASIPGFDGPQSYDAFYAQHKFDTLALYAGHISWRFDTFLATLPAYLELLMWPTGLHMERAFGVYDGLLFPAPLIGLGMMLFAATILACALTPRGRSALPLSWGILWFAVTYFPNTGLIFPMNSQFLEHWMYTPTIGLFLGIGETIAAVLARAPLPMSRIVCGIMLVFGAILGVATFEQNAVWRDPFTFYGNIFKYGEVSPRAHNNLALAYMTQKDYPAAVIEFGKAIAISDTYPEVRFNLALALIESPNQKSALPLAIESLNRALALDPTYYRAWEKLGDIHDHMGDITAAKQDRAKAAYYFNGGK